MSNYTTITSQEQYSRYKAIRKSFNDYFSEVAKRSYNELTMLIVEWDIKQDPDIVRSKPPVRYIPPEPKEVIVIKASKHTAKKKKEKLEQLKNSK